MKKFIRIPYEQESAFSADELKKRLDMAIEKQKELSLYKLKGAPLFLLSEKDGEYTLNYHHSYKKDMCDTCLRFYIEKGLERASAKGFFCKPRGVWATFWGVIATLLIDFLIISYCLLFTVDFSLSNALMISFTASIVRAYLCISMVRFTDKRVKDIRLEMNRLLNESESEADAEVPEKDGENA